MSLARSAALAAVALALGGCAFKGPMTTASVDHNQMIADSANRLTLLNVLRASHREPLHFTSISKLSASASTGGTAGSLVQAREQSVATKTGPAGLIDQVVTEGGEFATPSLTASVTANSNFDVAVLDTQEFYQGITASVPAGTIAHYLHQGWPADLLTHLFVSQVDFVARADILGAAEAGKERPVLFRAGAIVSTLHNNPHKDAARFEAFVDCYRLASKPRSTPDRQLVRLSDLNEVSAASLAILDGDKFDIEAPTANSDQPRWILRKGRTSDGLTLEPHECKRVPTTKVRGAEAAINGFVSNPPNGKALAENQVDGGVTLSIGDQAAPVDLHLVLRSTDGLIYYLGEYIRDNGGARAATSDPATWGIINVVEERPAHVFTSVAYRGRMYYVPATQNRGPQAFALIQQLVNLQKSAKDKPTTQTVRILP